jgi:uncharacterized protein
MSVIERGADLQYRFFDAVRSRKARDLASGKATASDFEALRGARQCLVVTFKRSGEGVPTPVNFGLSDGRVYFRSEPRSAKVARLRRNSRVLVAPCNLRGKPTGAAAEGSARVVEAGEVERAEAAVAGNWSAPMKLLERGLDRMPLDIVYVEVTPE